jgi:hypothetical protein
MSRLTLSYQNLYDRVSHFLGLTAEGTSPTGTNLTLCQDIVARGLRQFLYPIDMKYGTPHQWSFLSQPWSFTTSASQWKYPLPIDFSDLIEGFSYDTSEALSDLKKASAQQIKQMRSMTNSQGWPEFYAVVPVRYDMELGTTYELWLYPTPSSSWTLSTFYRIDPMKLSATGDLAVGGISACEAILESCLAVAETQEEDNTSTHHQKEAERLIQTLIRFDSGKIDTGIIGNLYSGKWNVLNENSLIVQDINTTRDIYSADR